MRFKSESQRLAHPQACLIPSSYWVALFANTLSDVHLELMCAPTAALTSSIIMLKEHSAEDKLRYWLCIVLSHTSASDDELLRVARELSIPSSKLLHYAALAGRLSMFNRLAEELGTAAVLRGIKAENYKMFRDSAETGHLAIMERLIAIAPDQTLKMLKANEYAAFREVAVRGHLPIMEKLISLGLLEQLISPAANYKLKMIMANNYEAFGNAARGGHLTIMNKLLAMAPAELLNMVKADYYFAFRAAVHQGNLAIMARLIEIAPTEVFNMVTTDDNYALRMMVNNLKYLPLLERLRAVIPAQSLNKIRIDTIRADDYLEFRRAAGNGNLTMVNILIGLAPAEALNMVRADCFYAFRNAALGGHLAVMERMVEIAPQDLERMIITYNYFAFRKAAELGHMAIIDKLWELAPGNISAMLSAGDYSAFRMAVSRGQSAVISRLLSYHTQFAYAEMHEHEYRHITHPFISGKLATLRWLRSTLEAENPHAVFDLGDADARCCFYMIRNLIRRNRTDGTSLDDIRFLLEIPAVKAMAHSTSDYGAEPNELIRLAITIGNQAAAEILLNIPAVRELTLRRNYYRDEAHGAIDLPTLVRDRESAMQALSTGEQARIAAAIERYQPMMREVGAGKLFADLRASLVRRYQRHPATIILNGVERALPIDWDAFERLSLTTAQREAALKAYYQHKVHSALRYLSIPNYWMAHDASYVYINEARTQRWSTFEEYKSLIVMLGLAAWDESVAPTDGHTLDGRIEHFIDELAHIGRAHNWDRSRGRLDGCGHVIEEEYDDLEGDKPSCFSGVKRRLFQSVIGHPLLKILTEQDIKQELRDFVRAHFSRLITAENRAALQNALTVYYGSVELKDAAPLRALNITTAQQAEFTQQLTAKYGRQFSEEARFLRIITTAFTLVESTSIPSDCMHALKFAALVNLEQLLQTPPVVSAAALGMFAGTSERDAAGAPIKHEANVYNNIIM